MNELELPKGCFYCKHYIFDKKGITEKKCLIGKDEAFRKWWKDNDYKSMDKYVDEMPCYEECQ